MDMWRPFRLATAALAADRCPAIGSTAVQSARTVMSPGPSTSRRFRHVAYFRF
jgi:hypothetical protein